MRQVTKYALQVLRSDKNVWLYVVGGYEGWGNFTADRSRALVRDTLGGALNDLTRYTHDWPLLIQAGDALRIVTWEMPIPTCYACGRELIQEYGNG